MITFDFKNRTAVVTGVGGGMGEAISKYLVNAGCYVMGVDVKSCPESLKSMENFDFMQGDLTDEGFVNEMVKLAFEKYSRLDYLCNVAGVLWFDKDKSVFDMDLKVWDDVFDINLKSMVYTTRACQPFMKQSAEGSAMVHFSTVQWMRGDAVPQDAYVASKAAVSAFSRSLAMQMASDNIRSNVICPGQTMTPLQDRWDSEEKLQAVRDYVPMNKIGTPDDMANTALFLLSDGAGYITGIDVVVDGGLILRC